MVDELSIKNRKSAVQLLTFSIYEKIGTVDLDAGHYFSCYVCCISSPATSSSISGIKPLVKANVLWMFLFRIGSLYFDVFESRLHELHVMSVCTSNRDGERNSVPVNK